MYSRQGTHPERVTGTPHRTPDRPSRPLTPVRPARAPMSDCASRDLARQHGRRTRRAAHRRMRTRAYESRPPGAEPHLDAQRAQQPRYGRLPHMNMHDTAHTSDALTTRSTRAAARSAAACRSARLQPHSLIDLRREGRELARRGDAQSHSYVGCRAAEHTRGWQMMARRAKTRAIEAKSTQRPVYWRA